MKIEKYLTETKNKYGETYGWEILAKSLEEAEQIAERRGIGEKVMGKIPYDCTDCEWEGELTEEQIKKYNIKV